jgi:biopolymer transport protein ExbD
MNKLRPVRFKNIAVDMTAMCDVAFLLLCFFVVTARFKQWEPMNIKLPVAANHVVDGDFSYGRIYIAAHKVMFQIVSGTSVREFALLEMAKKYHIRFSQEERNKFLNAYIIGSPLNDLKRYNDQYMNWTDNVDRPGIPYINNNELFDWIINARRASLALTGTPLRIIIQADKNEDYTTIKQVIAVLQKQNVNKFSLLTDTHNSEQLLK